MTFSTAVILTHVCCATIALLSGTMAMLFRKGSGWHGAAGSVFYFSMLGMAGAGAYIATFLRPAIINVAVSCLALYLVTTSRRAVKVGEGTRSRFDYFALVWIAGVSVLATAGGIEAAGRPTRTMHGVPAALYFVFATMALLCAITDVRMLRRGGLFGKQRIVRHLWRMGMAFLLAAFSFYPGQARLFPQSMRTNAFLIPHALLLASLLYWRWRYRTRQRRAVAATEITNEQPLLSV